MTEIDLHYLCAHYGSYGNVPGRTSGSAGAGAGLALIPCAVVAFLPLARVAAAAVTLPASLCHRAEGSDGGTGTPRAEVYTGNRARRTRSKG